MGILILHAAGDQAHVSQLLQHVHAEPPGFAVHFHRIGEVGAAVLVEDPPVALVEHREDQPDHLLVVDRAAIQRPQRSRNANVRRPADFQVQIAPLELDHRPKELVDFEILGPLAETHFVFVGGNDDGAGTRHVFFCVYAFTKRFFPRLPY